MPRGITLVELLRAGLSDVDHNLSAPEYLISNIDDCRPDYELSLTSVFLLDHHLFIYILRQNAKNMSRQLISSEKFPPKPHNCT